MKLLVTGGLGFIGSNFILKILSEYKDFSIINVDAEFFGSNKKKFRACRIITKLPVCQRQHNKS